MVMKGGRAGGEELQCICVAQGANDVELLLVLLLCWLLYTDNG